MLLEARKDKKKNDILSFFFFKIFSYFLISKYVNFHVYLVSTKSDAVFKISIEFMIDNY